ncbi:MAG: hypothetical protein GY774_37905 [Planctomycetes bacterium]|nr:hypothetical protein [Planctomycetota bacterium]
MPDPSEPGKHIVPDPSEPGLPSLCRNPSESEPGWGVYGTPVASARSYTAMGPLAAPGAGTESVQKGLKQSPHRAENADSDWRSL